MITRTSRSREREDKVFTEIKFVELMTILIMSRYRWFLLKEFMYQVTYIVLFQKTIHLLFKVCLWDLVICFSHNNLSIFLLSGNTCQDQNYCSSPTDIFFVGWSQKRKKKYLGGGGGPLETTKTWGHYCYPQRKSKHIGSILLYR